MNRPTITKDMILEAATLVAACIDGADAETIAEHYQYPMDGYRLARDLDRLCGWDFTTSDVNELDSMDSHVLELHRKAERAWGEANPMQPPFPVGATLKEGVIAGIYEHQPAYYRVKENGCEEIGRFLLIRFEDAVAA